MFWKSICPDRNQPPILPRGRDVPHFRKLVAWAYFSPPDRVGFGRPRLVSPQDIGTAGVDPGEKSANVGVCVWRRYCGRIVCFPVPTGPRRLETAGPDPTSKRFFQFVWVVRRGTPELSELVCS